MGEEKRKGSFFFCFFFKLFSYVNNPTSNTYFNKELLTTRYLKNDKGPQLDTAFLLGVSRFECNL